MLADGSRNEDQPVACPRFDVAFDAAHFLVGGSLPSPEIVLGAIEIAIILGLAG